MRKLILGFVGVFILALLSFYFWGSANLFSEEKYNQIVTYHSDRFNGSDTLSISTYNIGYLSGMTNNLPVDREESLFSQNLSRSVDILGSYNFDFIALQEIDFGSSRSFDYNQFDSLGNSLGMHQGAYAVNWDKAYVPFPYLPFKNQFGRIYSGQGILSKIQILSNDLEILDKPLDVPFYYNAFYLDRILQISKIQIDSDTLLIMNVHLEAFDLQTRQLQAKEVLAKFLQFSVDYPVVLLGDFNSRPPFANELLEEEKTMKMFYDHPLIEESISRERYLANEATYFTFDTEAPFERLDYIFYNKSKIKRIDSDVLREAADISDHLPVWMTFTLIE